jgi:hypothetical protein
LARRTKAEFLYPSPFFVQKYNNLGRSLAFGNNKLRRQPHGAKTPLVDSDGRWGLFTFMATLDGSIVNIALPVISNDMHIMTQPSGVDRLHLSADDLCAFALIR